MTFETSSLFVPTLALITVLKGLSSRYSAALCLRDAAKVELRAVSGFNSAF